MKNYSYKEVFKITLPIIFSLIMQNIIALTDTAFLGRVGEVELGASALGSVYYLAIFMIGFGFCNGTQILVARRYGENNCAKIAPIVGSSMIAITVIGIVFVGLSLLLSPLILGAIIKSENVLNATLDYVKFRVLGLPFIFIVMVFRAFFVGVTKTQILAWNSALMVLSNVFLDYALIFGKCSFPEMGIAGAGLASSCAELIVALGYFIFFIFFVDLDTYNFKKSKIWNFAALRQVLSLSIWTMLQMSISVAVWMFFFVAIEHLGERSLAVVNLVRNLSALAFLIINAFAITAGSLTSNLIGAGNRDGVWDLSWRIIFQASWILIPLLFFMEFFYEYFMKIYTNNADLITATKETVFIMLIGSAVQLPARVLHSVVSGTGSTQIAMWIESAALAVYTIAVWYFAVILKGSTQLCWSTEILYQIVILIGVIPFLRYGNWKKRTI